MRLVLISLLFALAIVPPVRANLFNQSETYLAACERQANQQGPCQQKIGMSRAVRGKSIARKVSISKWGRHEELSRAQLFDGQTVF